MKYRMRWEGHAVCMGKGTKYIRGFGVETRLLGRPRHRWEDNIKMDLK
jgi:hypothetical protein